MKLTSHTIVKNEALWIKPALLSVIDHMDQMLVWDTGSTDKTVELIKSIKSPKIKFKKCGSVDRKQLVNLRNHQIKATKTPWFLILDGDEIWPAGQLLQLIKAIKKAKPDTLAIVNKTRNCIGDIHHYLPESKGEYQIGKWQGHLNIRAIKNSLDLKVTGQYPLEAYTVRNIPLQDQPQNLEFTPAWYLHTTHLKRTNWLNQLKVIDRIKKFKYWGKRLKLNPKDLQGLSL